MAYLTLEAHPRSVLGKRVKSLRRRGLLPGNVYGHNVPSQALEVDAHAFQLLQRHVTASSLLQLRIDGGEERPVMIHHVQRDFRTGRSTHIEFFQVNMNERVTTNVSLTLTGLSEGVRKNEGVVLLQELDSIEVTSLPGDLPGSIEVPVDRLKEAGDAIYVRDLILDRSRIEVRTNEDDRVASLAARHVRLEEEAVEEPVAGEAVEGAGEDTEA
jgi:large subunit ribosomal protein L25